MATPHDHADFQRALLEKSFRRRLGQKQHEGKACVDDREIQPRVERAKMTGRDRAAAGEEPVGEPAKGKYFKGPSVDRECTRLGHALGAPLQHYDRNLRQRELAGEPQPDRATANDSDVEFLVHGEYSYSAAMTR
jgi:hypothetical protein